MSRTRAIAIPLALVYTVLLLVSTLGPIPQRLIGSEAEHGVLSFGTWFDAATWTSGRLYEFALNVVLFVPWGVLVLLAVGARFWWLAASAGLLLTLAIEIIQIPLPRISDPRDLVANAIGVVIGVLVGAAMARRPRARLVAQP